MPFSTLHFQHQVSFVEAVLLGLVGFNELGVGDDDLPIPASRCAVEEKDVVRLGWESETRVSAVLRQACLEEGRETGYVGDKIGVEV